MSWFNMLGAGADPARNVAASVAARSRGMSTRGSQVANSMRGMSRRKKIVAVGAGVGISSGAMRWHRKNQMDAQNSTPGPYYY